MKQYLTYLWQNKSKIAKILGISVVMIAIMIYVCMELSLFKHKVITVSICSIPILFMILQVYGEWKTKEGFFGAIRYIFRRDKI